MNRQTSFKNNNSFFNYVGKLNRLVVPEDFVWPRPPIPFLDLSGNGILIEENCSISSGVSIFTHSHYFENENWRNLEAIYCDKLIIKRSSFIGINSIILYPCKYIGISSVIGAGSVVNQDIPDYEMWAGNPARKIKNIIKMDNSR